MMRGLQPGCLSVCVCVKGGGLRGEVRRERVTSDCDQMCNEMLALVDRLIFVITPR